MVKEDADDYGFATKSVHSGQRNDGSADASARAPPIYQTTSYVFDDTEEAADLFALEKPGNVYSRITNPTNALLEERVADLEGGVGAVATASGMASFDLATLILARAGDNIVSASSLYGGTYTYLTHTAARRGVRTKFVDTLDYEAYRDAIDEDTAFVHLETIGNPSLITPEIEEIADIAHDHDVPLLVDNTFATPYLSNPIEHGADLVWNSTTKWIHGSGSIVGGILVDGGTFPWEQGDYEEITENNPAYHGLNFRETFGDLAFTVAARARALRDVGSQQSPFDSWLTLQKLESLPVRMEKHCENALAVAEFLSEHSEVSWVSYPGLPDHETHDTASKYLDGGYGGMITFGLEDGFEAAKTVCNSVRLTTLTANVGDAKTLIIHPASTTHQQLTQEEQFASGVSPDLLRLSAGIEDVNDIISDLDAAISEV